MLEEVSSEFSPILCLMKEYMTDRLESHCNSAAKDLKSSQEIDSPVEQW